MEQDRAVNKVITTIRLRKMVIAEDDLWFLRECFKQLYAAGWEESIKVLQAHNKCKVAKYSLTGKLLGEYDSIIEGSKSSGYHKIYGRNAIHACLNGTTKHTKQGHIWKYVND
jgi:hypothetical protein